MLKYLDEDIAYFLSNGKGLPVILCVLAAIMTFSLAIMCLIASLISEGSLLFAVASMSNLGVFGCTILSAKFSGYKLKKGD